MGLRMSSPRFDSSDVTTPERLGSHSHQHRRSISPATGPRTRSVSHNHQHIATTGSTTDGAGSSSGRRTRRVHGHTGHNAPPGLLIDRLIAEIEANGGVISPDDPRIIRLLRAYRGSVAEGGETSGRARPVSVIDAENLIASIEGASLGRSHRSRRSGGRQRSSASASAANVFDNEGLEERLSAVRRQVLLSLAASSSSSPHRRRQWPESLLLLSGSDRPCIFCKRMIPHDDYDLHYVMCLTRPRVTYNEDTLQMDKGECSICLEDMKAGDLIARLPCLCIYHKKCIDTWFQRKQTCPEHPGD